MKADKLRELSSEELALKEKSFKKELFDLNFQRQMGNVEKPGRFRVLKRDIARVNTILREREMDGAGKKADSNKRHPKEERNG